MAKNSSSLNFLILTLNFVSFFAGSGRGFEISKLEERKCPLMLQPREMRPGDLFFVMDFVFFRGVDHLCV